MLNVIAGIHGTGVAASTTSYESIATVTVGSGGTSYAEFTSIPNTYKHLQIRGISRGAHTDTGSNAYVALNNGLAGSAYYYHFLKGNGSSATAGAGQLGSSVIPTITYTSNADTSLSNAFTAFVVDILDYANTNKYKTMRTLFGYDLNGSGQVALQSNLWSDTSAVTSIRIANWDAGWKQYSQFALYGIKG